MSTKYIVCQNPIVLKRTERTALISEGSCDVPVDRLVKHLVKSFNSSRTFESVDVDVAIEKAQEYHQYDESRQLVSFAPIYEVRLTPEIDHVHLALVPSNIQGASGQDNSEQKYRKVEINMDWSYCAFTLEDGGGCSIL